MNEALEILTLAPREWPAILKTRKLWKVEALFGIFYLFRFPSFDIWLQTRKLPRPREDFRYGETPYMTGLKLVKMAGINKDDVLYDLGSGRGKFCFLAHLASGCQTVGMEMLPSYTIIADRIKKMLRLDGIEFRSEDFLEKDISKATVLFTAATSWSPTTKERLLERVEELKPGTRWLSVGWELRHPLLDLKSAQELLFSWGHENAWLYTVKDHSNVSGQDASETEASISNGDSGSNADSRESEAFLKAAAEVAGALEISESSENEEIAEISEELPSNSEGTNADG